MKTLPIFITVFLILLCSCGISKDGDGYVPIDGLSFGMSLDEVRKIYPDIISADPIIYYSYDSNEFNFPDLPKESILRETNNRKMQLENIKVYDTDSTARFYFGTDTEKLGDETYTYSLGLYRVEIEFNSPVDRDEIKTNLIEMFDLGETRFTSKTMVENMDVENRDVLKEYMTNLPFADTSGEKSLSVDRWWMVKKSIENSNTGGISFSRSYSMRENRLINFAYGNFDLTDDSLWIEGIIAAYNYNIPS